MKLVKTAGVLAVALGLVGLSATAASAQAPTVTWQQLSSTALRVDWTAVPQASSYEVFVSGAGIGTVGPIPVATTFFVVSPVPPGNYLLAVRGRAGNAIGPLSNPVTVTMGSAPAPPGCAIAAPSVNTSTAGAVVNVTWGAVAGAIGYRLQLGTAPGATSISTDVSAAQTSYSTAIPAIGTFYVRVITANACGAQATSADAPFTIGSPTPGPPVGGPGPGPRTPDPAPGQIIPRSSLGYLSTVVSQVAARNPGALQNSCGSNAHTFVNLVLFELRKLDSRWGYNFKRGYFGDVSHDIVAYNPTNRADDGEQQIYLFDVIGGHATTCGQATSPYPNWQDQTDPTWAAGGRGECANRYCARWSLEPYLRAGYPADPRQ